MNAAPDPLTGIHVTRWGHAGIRVVLVHGGAQGTAAAGHKNFWAQEPLAEDGWQLLVPDRPGHGLSPDPGRPDDAEADAAWVAELLGGGAHLVGHSFGGLIALLAATRRPEAVRSLILIEPALLAVATRAPAVRKVLLRMAATMVLPFSNATRAKRLMKLLGIPDAFALTETDLAALGASLKRVKFPPKKTIEAALTRIGAAQIPLLIISGSAAPAFIATGEIAATAGGGRHVIVPAEHHFPQWAGTPFNLILADFWRQADAR